MHRRRFVVRFALTGSSCGNWRDLTAFEKPFHLSVKVAILDRDGRCLLLKRSRSSKGNPGKWDLPGGKVDPGENFDQALIREVLEETGLGISVRSVLGSTQCELPDRKIAYIIMEGYLRSGSVCVSAEHDEFAWVEPAELHEVDLVEQFKEFARDYGQKATSQ